MKSKRINVVPHMRARSTFKNTSPEDSLRRRAPRIFGKIDRMIDLKREKMHARDEARAAEKAKTLPHDDATHAP